jgi:hypothetical protein
MKWRFVQSNVQNGCNASAQTPRLTEFRAKVGFVAPAATTAGKWVYFALQRSCPAA